jgi:hypothetical protein
MRKLLTILFLFLTLKAVAKKDYNWMNAESDWKRLKLEEGLSIPSSEIDTAIIVVSNRLLQKDSLRFMREDLQKDKLHYFFVYVNDGIWHVLPTSSLYNAIRLLPHQNNDWVVYTEGMGKVFTADLDRGIRLSSFYKVNVVLLDYPSISSSKGSLSNYNFAKRHARDAYKDFAPVIDTIKVLRDNKLMGTGSMSFFFHSMGNNVMQQLVNHDKLKNINNTAWVDNLILNAPCVKQRKHRNWVNQINFAKNIYVHYNPKDKTLYFAELAGFSKQLGRKVKNPLAQKAIYINFNSIAAENHSIFLPLPYRQQGPPEIFEHYSRLFHGGTIKPGDSKAYAPTAYRKIGWDLLPQNAQSVVNH